MYMYVSALIAFTMAIPLLGAPRGPFDDAVAVWSMAGLEDSAGRSSRLTPSGTVEVGIELTGEERDASLRRGGDGRAARFDGGHLSAGQGAGGELNLAGSALSVCVRLRDPSGAWDSPLFSKHGGHERLVYNLFSADLGSGMAIGFELGTSGTKGMTQVFVPLSLVGAREWHDVIARTDGAKLQLFIDGVLMDEGFPAGSLRRENAEPCLIGAESHGGSVKAGFHGMIAHVALWDRALTDAEVESLSGGADEAAARRRRYLDEPVSLQYWRPQNQFNVGDTFPFFHDGTFHFYYLLDRGHHSAKGGRGAHQWAHASSRDLVHWEHHPLAVAITAEREASICTGSVFFHDGTWYAFYATRTLDGGEALSLATGTDGIRFRKTEPNPFLSPGPRHTRDFRDPNVFLDRRTGLFHLLVASVLAQGHRGCLAHFTSPDLKAWKEEEPFVIDGGGALECPDHFEWNGRYYLVYNGGYRTAADPLGPWSRPKVDRFDGPLFAVPKTAAFTGNRRIVTAWLSDRGFGGRAVFRELVQLPDGTLGTRFLPEMLPATGQPVPLDRGPSIEVVSSEAEREETIQGLPRNAMVKMRIAPGGASSFGLRLRASAAGALAHELRFTPPAREARVAGAHALQEVDGLDRPFDLELILKDDILDVSIDRRRTLIDVVPPLEGDRLVLFARGGKVTFEGIEVRCTKKQAP